MARLEGKVAIVTGAAQGMGAATARLFVHEGARVVLGDVLEEKGRALAAELGDAAIFTPLDVSDESSWESAVAVAVDRFGGLDILVNNAGVMHWAPIEDLDVARTERLLDINVLGNLLGAKAVVPTMKKAAAASSSTSPRWTGCAASTAWPRTPRASGRCATHQGAGLRAGSGGHPRVLGAPPAAWTPRSAIRAVWSATICRASTWVCRCNESASPRTSRGPPSSSRATRRRTSRAPNSRWTAVGRPARTTRACRVRRRRSCRTEHSGASGGPGRGGHNVAVSSEIAPPRSTTISIPGGRVPRIHPAWFVAVVAFLALVGAASFRRRRRS